MTTIKLKNTDLISSFTNMNEYVQKYENISFDINKMREAVDQLIKIRPFEQPQKDGLLKSNAICLNYDEKELDEWFGGNVRGKYWTYPKSDWNEEERLININEEEYTEVCSQFKNTYIEEVYNIIKSQWKIGRMRFLMKPPRSCLSWHRDPEKRIHIPIITNPGCRMVIEDESYHMPADGSVYITDNSKYHNFFNGGETDRLHLVSTLIE